MALTPTEEALTRQLIAQTSPLLSLASSEPQIVSNLGANEVTIDDLDSALSVAPTDLFLIRQGTQEKRATAAQVFDGADDALRADLANNTDPLKGLGIQPLNLALNYPANSAGDQFKRALHVENFRQTGDTDDVQMFERAVAYFSTASIDGEILAKANIYNFNTRKLVVNASGITVKLGRKTVVNHETPDYIAFEFTGIGCKLQGGRRGGIVGAAISDAGNGATAPTYAVVRATGDYFEATDFCIRNVRQIGVLAKDLDHVIIKDFDIDCNVSAPAIPLVTTFHCGVLVDPGTAATEHSIRVQDGNIKRGIQGVFVGNYGTGVTARAVIVSGMNWSDMWDHGLYSNYTAGISAMNNTASYCHTPIAASGSHNIIKGLTVINEQTPVALNVRNGASAVSLRDPRYCIVDGITITGHGNTSGNEVIGVDCQEFAGIPLVWNIITNVTMEVVTGVARAVRFDCATTKSGFNHVSNINYKGNVTSDTGVVDFTGSGTEQECNKITDISMTITGGSGAVYGVQLFNQINSVVKNIQVKIDFDAAAATNITMVSLLGCQETKAEELRPYVTATKGVNINLLGVREFTSASMNESADIKPPVMQNLVSWTPALALNAASKFLIEYSGDAAPGATCRAGSKYTRLTGGVGTTLYVNRADGNNWFGYA